jgi:membrane associated rhomboid family serine protease
LKDQKDKVSTRLDDFLNLNCEPEDDNESQNAHFIEIICILVHIFCMIFQGFEIFIEQISHDYQSYRSFTKPLSFLTIIFYHGGIFYLLSCDDSLGRLDLECSIRTLVFIEVYTFNSGIIAVVFLVILSRISKESLQHKPKLVDYDYVLLQQELSK